MASLKDRIPEKKKVDELKKILAEKFHVGGFFSKAPETGQSSPESDEKKVEALKNLIQQKTIEAKQNDLEVEKPVQEGGLFGFFQKKPKQTPPEPIVQKQSAPVVQSLPITQKPLAQPKPKGTGFSFQGFLKSLEDKWYGFLDKVDEHVPVYNVVDRIDDVVPSFYVFIGIILLIVLLLLFFAAGPVISSFLTPEYSFLVADESGAPIAGAIVSIVSADQTFAATSGDDGSFSLKLPDSFVQITVSKAGFENFSSELDLVRGEPNKISLKQKLLSFIRKNVEVYSEGNLFDGQVRLTFYCSNPAANAPARLTVNDGVARDISFPENCGSMSVTVEAQGFETQTLSFGSESTLTVYLQSSDSLAGSVKVTLVDSVSGEAVGNASVALYDDQGVSKDSVLSSASGIALFEDIAPGNYYVQVSQARGYEEKTSQVFSVQPRDQTSFTLLLEPLGDRAIKKIFLKFVNSKTSRPVEGVNTWLVVNNNVLPPAYASDANGFVAIRNLSGEAEYGFIANHSDYVLFVEDDAHTVDEDSQSFTTVRLVPSDASNSMNAVVEVFDGQQKVQNAYVALYNKDYNFSIAWGNTNAEGKVRFEDLPPGTYHAFAQVEGQKEGKSNPKTGKAGETIALRVQLSNLTGGIRVVVVNDETGEAISDANVSLYAHPEGYFLDENKTNYSGATRDFNYGVDLSVYTVVSKPGFISMQSEPKQVLQDIVQTIPVRLVPDSGFDRTSPEIEFVEVQKLNSERVTGYLLDNTEYYLNFRMFVPQNNRDGNSVVFLENEFLRFRLAEMSGDDFTLAYFDCEDRQNPYNNPACGAGNPTDSTKQLRIGFGAVASQFYTFRIKINIPDIGDAKEQANFWYGEKIVNTSGKQKADPTAGLYEDVLAINEQVLCTESCVAFLIQVVDTATGVELPFEDSDQDGIPDKYSLELSGDYTLKVEVSNASFDEEYDDLKFMINPDPRSESLSIASRGTYSYTSDEFDLDAPGKFNVDISLLPDVPGDLVNEKFEIQDSGEQAVLAEILFEVLEPDTMLLESDKGYVLEGSEPQTVTITVNDSGAGLAVEGACVVMVKSAGKPTVFDCDSSDNLIVTSDAQGKAVFSILGPHELGVHYWFVAKKTTYADSDPPLEVFVRSESANFGDEALECVKVCAGLDTECEQNVSEVNTVLNAGETQKRDVFTVKSTCDEEISVKFVKEIASEMDQDSVQLKSGSQPGDEFTIGPRGHKTFSIETKSECPSLNPDQSNPELENKLCPGEYRVYVGVQTSADEENQSPAKISTVRVYKMPESINVFGLCKGENGENCDISAGAAAFYIGLLSGDDRDGIEKFVAKNNDVPNPPKNDLSFMDTMLSTCEAGVGSVCTDLQVAKNFATVTFDARMNVTIDGSTTIGSWHTGISLKIFDTALQETNWTLDSSDPAARAYSEEYTGDEKLEITFDVQSINENLPPGMEFEITNEMIEQGFQTPSDNSYGSVIMGRVVAANESATKADNPSTILNNSLLNDTGALLTFSDHVSRQDTGTGFLPVSFAINYHAVGGGRECNLPKGGFSIVADGKKQPLAVSSINSVKSQDETFKNCVDGLTSPSFEVSLVENSIEFDAGLCRDNPCQPSVCFSFSGEGEECSATAVTSDASLQVFAKTANPPIESVGRNYQLIYLFDTSGSVNEKWDVICDLISNDPQRSSVAAALSEKGIGVASTQVFAMGLGERNDVECSDEDGQGNKIPIPITYLPWFDEVVGDYTKIGKTILDSDYAPQCDVDGEGRSYCENIRADSEPEAWAPFLHTLIKIFSGEVTECPEGTTEEICSRVLEAGTFADASTPKLFIIGADSDPTGIFGFQGKCEQELFGQCIKYGPAKNSVDFWRHSEEWFEGNGGNNRNNDELISEEEVVQKLEELIFSKKDQFGSLNFYFTHGTWEAGYKEGFNDEWDGGCGENSDECNDLYEAMQHFTGFVSDNGIGQGFIETLDVDEFSSDIVNIVLNLENTQLHQERFHVILEAGDDAVCYGPDGREGVSGENAVSRIMRSFDWTWNAGFEGEYVFDTPKAKSFCSSELVANGGQNEDFVFCDSAQFTNMVLNRILTLVNGKDRGEWRATESGFQAALIKDGYNSSFLGDFSAWAAEHSGGIGRGIPTDLFGSNFNLKKYVDAGTRLNFVIQDEEGELVENNVLPQSGYYDVEIQVDFDRGYDGVFLDSDDNPTATITVLLTLKKALDSSDNLLYFLPFDGEIGLGGQRENYGVGYSLDEDEKILLFKKDTVTIETEPTGGGIANIDVSKLDEQDGAFELLNAQTVSSPDTSSRGIVLTLVKENEEGTNYSLEFVPAYASPVLVKITKPAGSLEADAAFYLTAPGGEKRSTNGIPLYNWVGVGSDVDQTCNGFNHRLIERGVQAEVDTTLSCGGGENHYGFDRPVADDLLNDEKTNVFGSLIYTLDNTSLSVAVADNCGQVAGKDYTFGAEVPLAGAPDVEELSVGTVLQYVKQTSFDSPTQGDYCLYTGDVGGKNGIQVWFNESDILRSFINSPGVLSGLNACFG